MSTAASIDELAEREGSKWADLDYDSSRPIMDMLGIIDFQRHAGDRAQTSEQFTKAFSHYSRAKYVLSMLRHHPGYQRLSPQQRQGLYQTTDYLDENLNNIVNYIPQIGWETNQSEESGSDQSDTDGEGDDPLEEDPWLGNEDRTYAGYHPDTQLHLPTSVHQRDSSSEVPQQHPLVYLNPGSIGSYYYNTPNSRYTGGAVAQTSIPQYLPSNPRPAHVEGTFRHNDPSAGLASPFLQLNINSSFIVSAQAPLVPQPQHFLPVNPSNNRIAPSRASSRGPPRAILEHRDVARPNTASGSFHRTNLNPLIFHELDSPQPESPQEYYTAPMDRIMTDSPNKQRIGHVTQSAMYASSDVDHVDRGPYRTSGYKYNPANGNYPVERTRKLSVASIGRNAPVGTEFVQLHSPIATQASWDSSKRGHPSRRRSLSDSGKYHTKNSNSLTSDLTGYYTAELDTAFGPTVTTTFAHEPGDYGDHPEGINQLEVDAIDQMGQRNWERAEILLRDVLERRRRTQGNSHLLTIQTMSNLGWAYQGLGKLGDAEAIFNAALRELRSKHDDADWRVRSNIENRLHITRNKLGDYRDYSYSTRSTDANLIQDSLVGDTNSPFNPPVIGSTTSPKDIIAQLTSRGCPDLTKSLDSAQCHRTNSSGGYGEIWCGVLTNNKCVALKQLRGDEKMNKRLCHELYIWSKTCHENILELWGVAWFQDRLVMVSPWMDGGNVEEYVRHRPDVNRLSLSLQVVNGVDYLHGLPLVHGDLKARNVFISGDGIVKIGDFGLSKLLGEQSLRFSVSGPQQLGTIRWAAPELFQPKRRISYPSDIYALGMTLLEIITGKVPFYELESVEQVVFAIAGGQRPQYPWEFSVHLGKWGFEMWSILGTCWDKKPQSRPDANSVLQQLEHLMYRKTMRPN